MSRFSPSVLPNPGPSFAESLANALSQGVGSYEHFRDIRQQRDDRERVLMDREDELALKDIRPPGWTPPAVDDDSFAESRPTSGGNYATNERPSGIPPGFDGSLAGAIAAQPDYEQVPLPPVIRSDSGHAGGWSSEARQFAPVPRRRPLTPVTLPSGHVFDAEGQLQQRLAEKLAEQQGVMELKRGEHDQDVSSRRDALKRLIGQPGYSNLTEAIAEAAAEDPTAYNDAVRNQPRAWHPTSMAEALELQAKEAEQTARARERHPSHTAGDAVRTAARKQRYFASMADEAMEAARGDVQKAAQAIIGNPETADVFTQGMSSLHLNAAKERFDRRVAKSAPKEKDPADMTGDELIEYLERKYGKKGRTTSSGPDDPGGPKLSIQSQDEYAHLRSIGMSDSEIAGRYNVPESIKREAPTNRAATHSNTSSGKPASHPTNYPAAPDSVLDELDQQFNGDVARIRVELKRRGFDPDA